MLSKNLPFSKKIVVVPMRNLLDAVSAWKGLLTGDGGYFVAIIRAHLSFIKWWLFYKKRSVFPVSRKGELMCCLQKNVAWLHFVKKKKYFSEIVDKTQ